MYSDPEGSSQPNPLQKKKGEMIRFTYSVFKIISIKGISFLQRLSLCLIPLHNKRPKKQPYDHCFVRRMNGFLELRQKHAIES